MTNQFLPDNYEIPTKPYFKFQSGDNTFRILDSPVIGYVYFTKENKPVRSKTNFTTQPEDLKFDDKGKPTAIKHFWALKVWNYHTNRIEILEITQIGILNAIKNLSKNPKWGTPLSYDIVVTKTGEGLLTEYTVMPEPKTDLTETQEIAFNDTYVNLEALFEGKDPFNRLS